jgi:hypothetical protein
MKKYLLFLITFLLATGVAYPQVKLKKVEPKKPETLEVPTINVLSPNGGEKWETGKRYTTRWTSKGVKGNVKIMLKYEYGPGRVVWYKITDSTPNTGSYSFTLPTDIIYEGPQFRIDVVALDQGVRDESDRPFSITTKKEITVVYPDRGEKLEQGRDYFIQWKSIGRIEYVKILIEDERAVRHLLAKVPNKLNENTTYRWRISPKLRSEKYRLIITSIDEKVKDESNRRVEIIPPEFELTCGFLEYGRIIKGKNYIFAAKRKTYMKFTVFVQNNGRSILNRVPFMWTILKQPLNDVVLQGEAGFGNVYPNRRYSTTFEFNYKKYARAWFLEKQKREFKKGDYRFVFEVDPRNELAEPEWARENNKCEVSFKIE